MARVETRVRFPGERLECAKSLHVALLILRRGLLLPEDRTHGETHPQQASVEARLLSKREGKPPPLSPRR
eukprot:COSAG01_NODE_2999_length_6737_cov_54.759114_9_plen_70_part_00